MQLDGGICAPSIRLFIDAADFAGIAKPRLAIEGLHLKVGIGLRFAFDHLGHIRIPDELRLARIAAHRALLFRVMANNNCQTLHGPALQWMTGNYAARVRASWVADATKSIEEVWLVLARLKLGLAAKHRGAVNAGNLGDLVRRYAIADHLVNFFARGIGR